MEVVIFLLLPHPVQNAAGNQVGSALCSVVFTFLIKLIKNHHKVKGGFYVRAILDQIISAKIIKIPMELQ